MSAARQTWAPDDALVAAVIDEVDAEKVQRGCVTLDSLTRLVVQDAGDVARAPQASVLYFLARRVEAVRAELFARGFAHRIGDKWYLTEDARIWRAGRRS